MCILPRAPSLFCIPVFLLSTSLPHFSHLLGIWHLPFQDLKLYVKWCRQQGVHVTPTCTVNGIITDTSSSWTEDQWKELLEPLFGRQAVFSSFSFDIALHHVPEQALNCSADRMLRGGRRYSTSTFDLVSHQRFIV